MRLFDAVPRRAGNAYEWRRDVDNRDQIIAVDKDCPDGELVPSSDCLWLYLFLVNLPLFVFIHHKTIGICAQQFITDAKFCGLWSDSQKVQNASFVS